MYVEHINNFKMCELKFLKINEIFNNGLVNRPKNYNI